MRSKIHILHIAGLVASLSTVLLTSQPAHAAGFWDNVFSQPNAAINQAAVPAILDKAGSDLDAAQKNLDDINSQIDAILKGNAADIQAQQADNTPPAPENVSPKTLYSNCSSFNPGYYHGLSDPFNGACVPELIKRLVLGLLGIAGALFFVMFVYGGFLFMTAGGDAKAAGNGQTVLTNAVIGMLITGFSYALVFNVINILQNANGSSGDTGATGAAVASCGAKGKGYSCISFPGKDVSAVMSSANKGGYQCQTGLCPGDFHNICCTKP